VEEMNEHNGVHPESPEKISELIGTLSTKTTILTREGLDSLCSPETVVNMGKVIAEFGHTRLSR